MKQLLLLAVCTAIALNPMQAQVTKSGFDELSLTAESYWNGSDGNAAGGFQSGDAFFVNSYNEEWGYWDGGFAYSNTSDVTTAGYTNDYSAITGRDYSGDGIYAPAQSGAVIRLTGEAKTTPVTGFYLTNSTYAALSMESGDQFAKKFGGASGDDADYFKLIVTGYAEGMATSTVVEAYLADFRNSDNRFDYILKNWRWVDLRPLGVVDSLVFTLASSDMTGEWLNTPAYFVIDEFNAPLFSPLGGKPGSTAISKDDAVIVNWAQACTVTRGPQDISSGASPLATFGADENATGPATGTTLVSLGDGGHAVLTFQHPIVDGEGPDFAVFENGFANGDLLFAELAFVEVSSDGEHFFRFPAVSNASATVQNNSTYTDPQLLHNLAGSAQVNYGTPFDLQELSGTDGLDLEHITHVRIVDVVGSLDPDYATFDKNGNPVNDPWETAFPSGGFDLDAVAVLHQDAVTGVISLDQPFDRIRLFPNPARDVVQVSFESNRNEGLLEILDLTGRVLNRQTIAAGEERVSVELSALNPGIYLLQVNGQAKQFVKQ